MNNTNDELVKVSTGALFHIDRAGLKMPQILIWLSWVGHANQWIDWGLYGSKIIPMNTWTQGFSMEHCTVVMTNVIHFICL